MVRRGSRGEKSPLLPKPCVVKQNGLPASPGSASAVGLQPRLGLANGVSLIVGSIVGAGVFVSPAGIVRYAGSAGMSLVVWALSGLACFIGALCYTELGTMIPKSGGDYTYISVAFGPLPGFLHLWTMLVIAQPAGNAVVALTLANYLLRPFYGDVDCISPFWAVRLIAACALCKLLVRFLRRAHALPWRTLALILFYAHVRAVMRARSNYKLHVLGARLPCASLNSFALV